MKLSTAIKEVIGIVVGSAVIAAGGAFISVLPGIWAVILLPLPDADLWLFPEFTFGVVFILVLIYGLADLAENW